MFTGIVEEIGTVLKYDELDTSESGGNGVSMVIQASKAVEDCHIGDSICVNGTCLTVTEFDKTSFKVGIAPETLDKTCLGLLRSGSKVNLERAMAVGSRFGGHYVQGHVDTTATIIKIQPDENSIWYTFKVKDEQLMQYIVRKGFIAIDGTSLTVCDVTYNTSQQDKDKEDDKEEISNTFSVMLIAHTQQNTIMSSKSVGDKVNIEVDMLGKYVASVVHSALDAPNSKLHEKIVDIVKQVSK
ncbi:hypothetical protein BB560_001779 [Smittium megazygosporum]|uniref:Riboflavin synthase n=1 Tax=Smittium megazygosporum TaxID=133381 RepID=A0A2T9ZGL4_9FUNG|nr:hypothetical protein BB560_001779 [Smittium megazygosporum]